jgi:hypothetical protein
MLASHREFAAICAGWLGFAGRQYSYIALVDLAKKRMPGKRPDLSTLMHSPITDSQETIFLDCDKKKRWRSTRNASSTQCAHTNQI